MKLIIFIFYVFIEGWGGGFEQLKSQVSPLYCIYNWLIQKLAAKKLKIQIDDWKVMIKRIEEKSVFLNLRLNSPFQKDCTSLLLDFLILRFQRHIRTFRNNTDNEQCVPPNMTRPTEPGPPCQAQSGHPRLCHPCHLTSDPVSLQRSALWVEPLTQSTDTNRATFWHSAATLT